MLSASVPRFPPWSVLYSTAPNMRPLVSFSTAYSLSSHRTALGRANARVLRKLGASICVGHGAISLSSNSHTHRGQVLICLRFLPPDEPTAPCLRRLYFSIHSPTAASSRRFGDGSDGCWSSPVVYRPSHPRRDPTPHQRLQYLRLTL
jgi:hypothetical protein